MNWPLFWALTLAFGLVISNLLLIKHAAKLKMPSSPKQAEGNKGNVTKQHNTTQQSPVHDQTPNSPE
ncbi:Protein of unknown function [Rheinheimera pacifica]|uniref:DUF2897 domain-containing protein n=1 Tax=Rheinheimera pacifica TaxID=173990 RepID=A0A1H6N7P1_9GAMM|nr:Protein of unknown function [Rheinheimera pacifica]